MSDTKKVLELVVEAMERISHSLEELREDNKSLSLIVKNSRNRIIYLELENGKRIRGL